MSFINKLKRKETKIDEIRLENFRVYGKLLLMFSRTNLKGEDIDRVVEEYRKNHLFALSKEYNLNFDDAEKLNNEIKEKLYGGCINERTIRIID